MASYRTLSHLQRVPSSHTEIKILWRNQKQIKTPNLLTKTPKILSWHVIYHKSRCLPHFYKTAKKVENTTGSEISTNSAGGVWKQVEHIIYLVNTKLRQRRKRRTKSVSIHAHKISDPSTKVVIFFCLNLMNLILARLRREVLMEVVWTKHDPHLKTLQCSLTCHPCWIPSAWWPKHTCCAQALLTWENQV